MKKLLYYLVPYFIATFAAETTLATNDNFCEQYSSCRTNARKQFEVCTAGLLQMIFAAQQRSGALNEENLIEAARVNEVNLAHRCHTDKQQQFFDSIAKGMRQLYERVEERTLKCLRDSFTSAGFGFMPSAILDQSQSLVCKAIQTEIEKLNTYNLTFIAESSSGRRWTLDECAQINEAELQRCDLLKDCCPGFENCRQKVEQESGIKTKESRIARHFGICLKEMEEQSPKQQKTVEGKSEGTATPEISEKTFGNTIGSEKINHLTTITEKAKAKSTEQFISATTENLKELLEKHLENELRDQLLSNNSSMGPANNTLIVRFDTTPVGTEKPTLLSTTEKVTQNKDTNNVVYLSRGRLSNSKADMSLGKLLDVLFPGLELSSNRTGIIYADGSRNSSKAPASLMNLAQKQSPFEDGIEDEQKRWEAELRERLAIRGAKIQASLNAIELPDKFYDDQNLLPVPNEIPSTTTQRSATAALNLKMETNAPTVTDASITTQRHSLEMLLPTSSSLSSGENKKLQKPMKTRKNDGAEVLKSKENQQSFLVSQIFCTEYQDCQEVYEEQHRRCEQKYLRNDEKYGISDFRLREMFIENSRATEPWIKRRCLEAIDPATQLQLKALRDKINNMNWNCTGQNYQSTQDSTEDNNLIQTIAEEEVEECREAKPLTAFSLSIDRLVELNMASGGTRTRENASKCVSAIEALKEKCRILHRCCLRHIQCERDNNRSHEAKKYKEIIIQLKEEQNLCEQRHMRIQNGVFRHRH